MNVDLHLAILKLVEKMAKLLWLLLYVYIF